MNTYYDDADLRNDDYCDDVDRRMQADIDFDNFENAIDEIEENVLALWQSLEYSDVEVSDRVTGNGHTEFFAKSGNVTRYTLIPDEIACTVEAYDEIDWDRYINDPEYTTYVVEPVV